MAAPAVCGHPHSSAGAYRIAGIAGITYSALARMPGPAGGQRLEAGVEAHAFHAVHRHVAEQRALQPPKLWNAIGTEMGTRAKRKPASRLRGASSPVAAPAICSTAAAASIPSPERTLENQVKTAPLVSNLFVKGGLLLTVRNITYWVICDFVLISAPPTAKPVATYRKA